MKQFDEVIAAIATPIGEGGIAVIRVSGKGAVDIVDRGFRGRVKLRDARSHTVHFGQYLDDGGVAIDEVLATIFRAPASYTAEDVVELSCHGGVYVTRKVLESVIVAGARLAEPGEFTKRAFLNGRIDLSQAEAVADLIKSRSELAHRSSVLQLQGSLSRRVNDLLERLVDICGLVELELDFVEENISLTSAGTLQEQLTNIASELESLVSSFSFGRLYRDGVKVVLVGRPNAGKSSLLNALLDQKRAIVTDIPGTTRDAIEESIVIGGLLLRLTDTAGLRHAEDLVEIEGVRKTVEQIKSADVCLYVVDIARREVDKDIEFIKHVKNIKNGEPFGEILVGNKIDLVEVPKELPWEGIAKHFSIKRVAVSALKRKGLEDLTKELVSACVENVLDFTDSNVTVTNERHKSAIVAATKSLKLAIDSIKDNLSGEIIALDLRGSIDALGTIVGKVTTDDILNKIFSKFCLGK